MDELTNSEKRLSYHREILFGISEDIIFSLVDIYL